MARFSNVWVALLRLLLVGLAVVSFGGAVRVQAGSTAPVVSPYASAGDSKSGDSMSGDDSGDDDGDSGEDDSGDSGQ